MKKLVTTIAAGLVAATSLVAVPASAQSASISLSFGQQDQFVGQQCGRHPDWNGCSDYRRNHNHWSRNDYRNWYMSNRPGLGGLGVGLFAFALGAAAASSAARANAANDAAWEDHVQACHDAYKSYNERTDEFLSYHDGYQRCRL
jgi:hypothetical protein